MEPEMTIERLHQVFLQSEGISTDTRQELKGRLFFALEGERFDGNRFVADALKKGCRLAITSNEALKGEQGVLYAGSPLGMLQQLAAYHRRQVSPTVIAITGSNGKTTTKELATAILRRRFGVLATRGNLNNHIGVPLTLLSLDREPLAVVEMGANHPGEIGKLAEMAAPDLGLITNVGKAHLEGFGSVSGVLDAKGELYEYLAEHGGKALVDGEDTLLLQRASSTGVEILVVGDHGDIRVSGRILDQSPFLVVELRINGEKHRLASRLAGSYNLQNIRLAAALGCHFGIAGSDIAGAIASFEPEGFRSQVIEGASNRVIMDSYNANPASMRGAIAGLMEYAPPPAMVILGDMAELGNASREEHARLVRWIRTLSLDRVVLAGPKFAEVAEPSGGMYVFTSVGEVTSFLESDPPQGYHILVKGSRIMELERLLPLLVG
jgi:UDP-N-acetylmuramoyl-tripeptide--D-alanyl-D-alanine ligase